MTPGFQDHFSGVADGYARYRPSYPDALFDYLTSLCAEQGRVWDCAAGSGQATLALADRFDRVIASDLSWSQLEQAPRRPNICYHLSAAEIAPLGDGSMDLVTVAQALHWFPRQEFFAEVQRVLKPAGIFAAWCYTLMSVNDAVDPIIYRFYHETIGPYWPLRRKLVEGAYRGVDFPLTEVDAPGFEMLVDWTLEELLGYLGTWSAVRAYRKAEGTDPLDRIRGPLSEAWKPSEDRLPIRWPLHARIGRQP